MAIVWHRAKVVSNQGMGGKFRFLKLKVIDDPNLMFRAGQYILMRMGESYKVNDYSPCNIPKPGEIEIIIDITPAEFPEPAGKGSRYIRDLKVGGTVEFSGPAGDFVYRDDGARQLWFVATGSGISSLWSVIRDLLNGGEKRPVKLWWGLRHREEIIWAEELENLKQRYPNFDYKHILSEPDINWTGSVGHVTESVVDEAGKSINKEELSVYLCGNNAMIAEASGGLYEAGVPKERVYWEKYF